MYMQYLINKCNKMKKMSAITLGISCKPEVGNL